MSVPRTFTLGCIVFFLFLLGVGCSEDTSGSEDDVVELKFAFSGSEEDFNERFKERVEDHFDNIKLNHMEVHVGSSDQLDEIIAEDNIPDIWITPSTGSTTSMFKKELAYDLSELFKDVDFDLSRLEENIVDEIRTRSNEFLDADSDIIGGLPLKRGISALFYNKDIFDLFGVEYPEDHMTWNEAVELASQVTQERDGEQYHGLHVHFHSAFTQHGIDHQDEDGNPQFDKEPGFRLTLDLMEELFNIQGNYPERPSDLNGAFMEGNLAMYADPGNGLSYADAPFEWDMVTYPVWEDLPDMGPSSNSEVIGITTTSEHPEEAFQVIDFLLSDDVQKEFSKQGNPSPLVKDEIHDVFGEEISVYDNLNKEALFEMTPQKKPDNRFQIEHSLEAAGEPWHGRVSDDFYEADMNAPEFVRYLQEKGEIVLKELEGQE